MKALVLAGSLVAILILAGVAHLLRLGRDARVTAAEATAAAETAFAGFATREVVIGDDGGAALVVGEDERLAVVKRHGARVAARAIAWSAVRQAPGGAVVETGERRFGAVMLTGVDALALRRLAGEAVRLAS